MGSEGSFSSANTPIEEVLHPRGPLGTLDRAFSLCARSGRHWAPLAWGASAPLLALGTLWFHAERVGWEVPSWCWVVAGVVAWWLRCHGLAKASASAVAAMWPGALDGAGLGVQGPLAMFALSSRLSVGLLPVAFLVLVGGWLASVPGVVLGVAAGALRGAFAPSWPAVAGLAPNEAHRAVSVARRMQEGRRWHAFVVEVLLFGGWFALSLDISLGLSFGGAWLRSAFGMDVALDAWRRVLHPTVAMSAASMAFWLLEPLRAAVAALAWMDARVRRDALDVQALVQRVLGCSMLALALLVSSPLFAQRPTGAGEQVTHSKPVEAPVASAGWDAEDAHVYRLSREVWRSDAFRRAERVSRGGRLRDALDAWLLRMWTRWRGRNERSRGATQGCGAGGMQGGEVVWWMGLVGLLSLALGVGAWLAARRRRMEGASEDAGRKDAVAERARDWRDVLSEAMASGEGVETVRLVYRVALQELDRAGVLRFDPHVPNGLLVRRAPKGPVRELLLDLTELFDRVCYGGEPPAPIRVREAAGMARRVLEGIHGAASGVPGRRGA